MQRADLSNQLEQVNARLKELQASDPGLSMMGQDLAMKASYFIMYE